MLTDLKTIKHLCSRYHLKPDKSFGQNFLINENVLHDIIRAADIKPTDIILEIGAGIGTLTNALAQHAQTVYAFEIDERLYPLLQETVQDKNVQIIKENITQTRVKLESIIYQSKGNYKIVANIPYNITGLLTRIFLELNPAPKKVVLMVQKEVAERIVAPLGKMSMLSIAVAYYAKPKLIKIVSKTSFFPSPKVDSALLEWVPYRTYSKTVDKAFFSLVRAGFIHPRKMLKNNFVSVYAKQANTALITLCMSKAGIKETARPGDLSVDKWIDLETCLTRSKVVL